MDSYQFAALSRRMFTSILAGFSILAFAYIFINRYETIGISDGVIYERDNLSGEVHILASRPLLNALNQNDMLQLFMINNNIKKIKE